MIATDWDGFDRWHLLLDALCRDRGHRHNALLASELCARSGRSRREDFEAAKKQLRTWRSGQRLPLKRNVSLLGQLLQVDRDPQLERQWLELYRRAQASRARTDRPPPPAPSTLATMKGPGSLSGRGTMLAGVALLCGLALSTLAGERREVPADLPVVNFEGRVRVPVGASTLIHGQPGRCDGAPPGWEEIAGEMPSSRLGTFADGGLARKVVRRCTGEKIVRGVMFTGIEAGTDGIRLFGDYIRIDVVSAP